MSDDKQATDNLGKTRENQTNETRRKLTKAGIASVPVILTLASRPVWATGGGGGGNGQCSPSVLMSGNLSAHPEIEECKLGCSPGFWTNCDEGHWNDAGYHRSDDFHSTFHCGGLDNGDKPFQGNPKLGDVMDGTAQANPTFPHNHRGTIEVTCFHAVAAMLNAGHPAMPYEVGGYTKSDTEIRNDFSTAWTVYLSTGGPNHNACNKNILTDIKNSWDNYDGTDGMVCPLPNHYF